MGQSISYYEGQWIVALIRADHHDYISVGTPLRIACAIRRGQLRRMSARRRPFPRLPRKGASAWSTTRRPIALKNGPDICPARRRPRQGAIVVVRPDQYVANMPPLDVYDELTAFFAGFLLDRK